MLRPLHYQQSGLSSHLAFAVFRLSFGYVAVQITHVSERRLLEIEDELKVARELQFSILPAAVPEVRNLRIAVAYRPMTAVAGDFYEFIPLDGEQVGFLVADATGHGVPAALIASMIKVAMQSVMSCADQPGEVLRGLNRILYGLLRDQLALRPTCGLIPGTARHCIQRQDTRRCCAGKKAGWKASKAMVSCSASCRRPITPSVNYRSTLATASCCTPMA